MRARAPHFAGGGGASASAPLRHAQPQVPLLSLAHIGLRIRLTPQIFSARADTARCRYRKRTLDQRVETERLELLEESLGRLTGIAKKTC